MNGIFSRFLVCAQCRPSSYSSNQTPESKKYWKWIVTVAVLVALFAWSITPAPFEYLDPEKKVVVFGTASHILPLVRIVNFVFHPFRKALVPLEFETLKSEAIEQVGFHDFGSLINLDELEKFAQVADQIAHFSGRVGMKDTITNILAIHLTIAKTVHENPEILQEKIEKPIFLAACSRSGSTFFYHVLADTFDEEVVPIYSYEAFGGPVQLAHKPPRKEFTDETYRVLDAVNPPLGIMHEFTNAEDPEEETGWYMNTMRGIAAAFILPSYWLQLNVLQESSVEMNRNFWETVLKIKQWKAGRKQRFILKAPEHLFGLPYLTEEFPDASFVTVHRNEESMYKSGLAVTHAYRHMFMEPTVSDSIAYQDFLVCNERKALEVSRDEKYDSKVMEVRFEDGLFTNTFEIIAKFAKHAGLPWDEAKQAHARSVIAKRLSWKKHKAKYRMKDFGFEDGGNTERLQTVCDNLPTTVEGLEEFYKLIPQ